MGSKYQMWLLGRSQKKQDFFLMCPLRQTRVGCVRWRLVNVCSVFWLTEEWTALLPLHRAASHQRCPSHRCKTAWLYCIKIFSSMCADVYRNSVTRRVYSDPEMKKQKFLYTERSFVPRCPNLSSHPQPPIFFISPAGVQPSPLSASSQCHSPDPDPVFINRIPPERVVEPSSYLMASVAASSNFHFHCW